MRWPAGSGTRPRSAGRGCACTRGRSRPTRGGGPWPGGGFLWASERRASAAGVRGESQSLGVRGEADGSVRLNAGDHFSADLGTVRVSISGSQRKSAVAAGAVKGFRRQMTTKRGPATSFTYGIAYTIAVTARDRRG